MILIVNGFLCFFMAFSAYSVSLLSGCDDVGGGATADCDPTADPMRAVAFGLVVVGAILLLLGLTLRPRRRQAEPATTPSDAGPPS